jgi:hypothetical protein
VFASVHQNILEENDTETVLGTDVNNQSVAVTDHDVLFVNGQTSVAFVDTPDCIFTTPRKKSTDTIGSLHGVTKATKFTGQTDCHIS